MVPRENKNNAYAKFGGPNKEYYGIFDSGEFKFTDELSEMETTFLDTSIYKGNRFEKVVVLDVRSTDWFQQSVFT